MSDERAEFQKWVKADESPLPSGNYTESEWERLFLVWQASARATRERIARGIRERACVAFASPQDRSKLADAVEKGEIG